jgi:MFS family permease
MSDGAIGVIMGSFAITSMLRRPWTGWAADRCGRRPFMLAGTIVFGYGASAGALALAEVRALHGAGMALYPTAASAMVADLAPPRRRGEFLGLFGAAGSIAMAIGPITGTALVARVGFTGLFTASAVSALGALALTLATPETLGERSRAPFTLGGTLNRQVLGPSAVLLCLMLTYGAQTTFLPLHAERLGLDPGVFFLVYALILTVIRGPAGRLSDRFGRRPVSSAGLALAALALLVLARGEGALGLAVSGALYGLAGGIAQPALMAWCLAIARWGFAATFVAAAGVAAMGAALALRARRPPPLTAV